jgi:hypothetical protein
VIVATIVLGALAGGAVVVTRLWFNDTARMVDADEAVERFREQTTAPPTVPASAARTTAPIEPIELATTPEPGVYRYVTTGRETIDSLGGTEHQYPAETTLTVTPDGCGVLMRWDLLKERYEEFRLCVTEEGIELQPTGAAYHEFFGVGQRQDIVCDREVLLVPADGEPREVVPLACRLQDQLWLPEWEVLECTALTVEGQSVDVTHVRMRIADEDQYWERTVVEWWLDDHGLPVRMTTTKESKSPSDLVGDVVYTETYTADLVTLEPLR